MRDPGGAAVSGIPCGALSARNRLLQVMPRSAITFDHDGGATYLTPSSAATPGTARWPPTYTGRHHPRHATGEPMNTMNTPCNRGRRPGGVLREAHRGDVAWSVAYLRERLAGHPAEGYETRDQAVAELRSGEGG